ncbi:MAG: bifunctional oligoribonuclease/PAP phosphatase NrnA [Wujia sp.]
MNSDNDVIKYIERAASIAILGHIRPDGDCVGSCLGLYNYITDNYSEKKVVVYLQPVSDKFCFLRGADMIRNIPDHESYELAVSLDCGDTDRHGEFAPIYADACHKLCLDHHRSNEGFGDLCICDPDASSTCEILYRQLDPDKIGRECAEAIYLGIVHDTGVFKYPCTTEETMRIAGQMISKGARSQYVIDETFYKVNYNQNRLTGSALLQARLDLNGKVISTCVTKEMFELYHANKDDTDGIVDKLRVTDGIEVAVFIYQLDDDIYKFSLRSVSYVDVSRIAVSFGGGGHIRAAGFEAAGDYRKNLGRILEMIEDQLM